MAVYDPTPLLDPAEEQLAQAAHAAVAEWVKAARTGVLGGSGSVTAAGEAPPPNLEGWPAPSLWARLVEEFLLPVIGTLFGEAFAAAARSDLLQVHSYRTQWVAEAQSRLSEALWPADAYERIRSDLQNGLDLGESVPKLRDRIAKALHVDRFSYAAERIARTEAHSAVEGGTHSAELAWEAETGEVLYRMWWATPGPRTRPSHAAAHGQVVALGEPFRVGGATLRYPGDPAGPPAETINCFPGDVSVTIPGGSPSAIYRRWYEGPLHEVRTVDGRKISGTPNHPLLTERGWVKTKDLQMGDKLICSSLDERVSFGDPYVTDAPTRLDQVYRSAHESGVADRVPRARVNFHGDRPDGDVDVVRPNRDLQIDFKATGKQRVDDDILSFPSCRSRLVSGSRRFLCSDTAVASPDVFGFSVCDGLPSAEFTSGAVGGLRQLSPLRERQRLHAQAVGFAARTHFATGLFDSPYHPRTSQPVLPAQGQDRRSSVIVGQQGVHGDVGSPALGGSDVGGPAAQISDPTFAQARTNDVGADLVDPGDVRTALSSAVTTDEVVHIESFDFSGHVYNLESPNGWYIANSIAVSNCRCTAITGARDELADLNPEPLAAGGNTMTDEQAPLMWRGVLAPLEVRGDFRVLAEPEDGVVPTTDLMWLSYQERSADAHDGKIGVGRIDRVWVEEGMLWGEGVFDAADPSAVEVARKVEEGFAGSVSIDLADADFEARYYDDADRPITGEVDPADIEAGRVQELVYVTNWRLGGVTLVQDPAFGTSRGEKSSARIWIVETEDGALTAAATGDARLPLAGRDHEWDGDAAKRRLAEAGRLNSGCFWREDDADPDSDIQADYKLPFADIVDGELVAVPRGLFAVASVLQGGMGGVDLPADAQDAIRDRVGDYYDRMAEEFDDPGIRAPWDDEDDDDDEGEPMAASAAPKKTWAEKVADAVPVHPPAKWFSNPQLTGLTKVRVTDQGRVFGHIADWNQTHIGHMGQRVYPPRCPDGGTYPRFHRHPVRTAEGDRINTGPLTTAGHASTDAGVTMSAAMAHYDDPRFVAANVVVGEDEFGIWVAGALRPGIEAWQVAFLDTYSFSGDWRNGNLVAACAVSVEGFFVPNDDTVAALAASAGVAPDTAKVRSRVDDGEVVALVSAGVVAPARGEARALARHDMHRLLAAIDTGTTQMQQTLASEVGDTVYAAVRRALADHQADQSAIANLAAELDLTQAGS